MNDEASGVTGLVDNPTQSMLQRSKWAHPAGEFDPGVPQHRRQVEPRQPGPAPYQQAAERQEQYERQVDERHHIGGQAKDERLRLSTSWVCTEVNLSRE